MRAATGTIGLCKGYPAFSEGRGVPVEGADKVIFESAMYCFFNMRSLYLLNPTTMPFIDNFDVW